MKLQLKTWRMPGTRTWYLWIHVTRKERKTGNPINVVYSVSTPAYAFRSWCSLLPGIEYEKHESVVQGEGPKFELRLSWLKWTIRLLGRDVWWGDKEDDESETNYTE